jgi:predicted Holliday junction resolvase-like endonuclease
MSQEIMNVIETVVIIPLLVAISSYVIAFLRKQTAKLQGQIQNENAKRLLGVADSIISQAVASVTQTYVDGLKADGAFTKEAQQEAFEQSKRIVLGLMTAEVTNAINENYGSVESWINTKIEEAVCNNK